MNNCRLVAGLALLVAGILSLALTGCKTTPKVDWNTRIGTYTMDQAIAELDPPDKTAKLSDGRTVAEWVVGRKSSTGLSIGTGVYGGHGGISVGQSVSGGGGLKVLRLTFDAENRLIAWTKT